mmetsp:Transcript_11215/g.16364  ORF Transcript_11215/g.16364 Transcript_11215/m.16364 type:complete len:111 (+) Transcript_11215:1022-1354(+)
MDVDAIHGAGDEFDDFRSVLQVQIEQAVALSDKVIDDFAVGDVPEFLFWIRRNGVPVDGDERPSALIPHVQIGHIDGIAFDRTCDGEAGDDLCIVEAEAGLSEEGDEDFG